MNHHVVDLKSPVVTALNNAFESDDKMIFLDLNFSGVLYEIGGHAADTNYQLISFNGGFTNDSLSFSIPYDDPGPMTEQVTAGLPFKKHGIFIPSYVQIMMDVITTYSKFGKQCPDPDLLRNSALWQNSLTLLCSICFYEDISIWDESEMIELPLINSCHWSHWLDIILHSYSLYIELLQTSIKMCTFESSSNKFKIVCTDKDDDPLWKAPFFLQVYPVAANKEFTKNQWQNFVKLVQQPIPGYITTDSDNRRLPLSFQECVKAYIKAKYNDTPSLFQYWSMEQCPTFRMRPSSAVDNNENTAPGSSNTQTEAASAEGANDEGANEAVAANTETEAASAEGANDEGANDDVPTNTETEAANYAELTFGDLTGSVRLSATQ